MKQIGVIFDTNRCCPDKPILIYDNQNGTYHCECECGLYTTGAYGSSYEALCDYVKNIGKPLNKRTPINGKLPLSGILIEEYGYDAYKRIMRKAGEHL